MRVLVDTTAIARSANCTGSGSNRLLKLRLQNGGASRNIEGYYNHCIVSFGLSIFQVYFTRAALFRDYDNIILLIYAQLADLTRTVVLFERALLAGGTEFSLGMMDRMAAGPKSSRHGIGKLDKGRIEQIPESIHKVGNSGSAKTEGECYSRLKSVRS